MWNEQNGSWRTQPNTLSERQDLGLRATKNPTRLKPVLRGMGLCLTIAGWVLLQTAQSQVLPAGATIHVQLKESLSSDTSHAGDAVEAVFSQALKSRGTIVIPAGSKYRGKVEHLQKQTGTDEAWMRLLFYEIEIPDGRRVTADASNVFRSSKPNRLVAHAVAIPVGAAGGAALGGRSARVAGLLGGALAGLLFAQNRTAAYGPLRLHVGQTLDLHLGSDVYAAGGTLDFN
jgi:hypothetical protein